MALWCCLCHSKLWCCFATASLHGRSCNLVYFSLARDFDVHGVLRILHVCFAPSGNEVVNLLLQFGGSVFFYWILSWIESWTLQRCISPSSWHFAPGGHEGYLFGGSNLERNGQLHTNAFGMKVCILHQVSTRWSFCCHQIHESIFMIWSYSCLADKSSSNKSFLVRFLCKMGEEDNSSEIMGLQILTRFLCVNFQTSGWICNPIRGWVDWTRFLPKASNKGCIKGFGS